MPEDSFFKELARKAAESTTRTITVGGIVLAGIWYFGPSVAELVALALAAFSAGFLKTPG